MLAEVCRRGLRSAHAGSAQCHRCPEIKALIDESVSHVGSGSQQIHTAGERLGELVSNVRQVRQLMGKYALLVKNSVKVFPKLRSPLPKWTAPFSKTHH